MRRMILAFLIITLPLSLIHSVKAIESEYPLSPIRGPAVPKPEDYVPYEGATAFEMTIPPIVTNLNGIDINNNILCCSLLFYSDIVYLPLSYDMCKYMNLDIQWDSYKGLSIENTDTYQDDIESLYGDLNKDSFPIKASLLDFDLYINNVIILDTPYPFIVYRDITYFPLTWSLVVHALHWEYLYQDNTLYISSR